jgi:hypothetical protein
VRSRSYNGDFARLTRSTQSNLLVHILPNSKSINENVSATLSEIFGHDRCQNSGSGALTEARNRGLEVEHRRQIAGLVHETEDNRRLRLGVIDQKIGKAA